MPMFPAAVTSSGLVRPYIPIDIAYVCPTCDEARHFGQAIALVDSGASTSFMPANLLPDHVAWDGLPRMHRPFHHADTRGAIEGRLWGVQLSALGAQFATTVIVTEPGTGTTYYTVGTDDFFRRFHVSFHFANVPPVFSVQPAGGVLPPSGLEVPSLPKIRAAYWEDAESPVTLMGLPGALPVPAPPAQLSAGTAEPVRASRQQRRAKARSQEVTP